MTPGECRQIFALLSEYLDGELPEDACRAIREHIAGCAPCVEFVESLRASMGIYRANTATSQPPPLTVAERGRLAEAYRAMLARRAG